MLLRSNGGPHRRSDAGGRFVLDERSWGVLIAVCQQQQQPERLHDTESGLIATSLIGRYIIELALCFKVSLVRVVAVALKAYRRGQLATAVLEVFKHLVEAFT